MVPVAQDWATLISANIGSVVPRGDGEGSEESGRSTYAEMNTDVRMGSRMPTRAVNDNVMPISRALKLADEKLNEGRWRKMKARDIAILQPRINE